MFEHNIITDSFAGKSSPLVCRRRQDADVADRRVSVQAGRCGVPDSMGRQCRGDAKHESRPLIHVVSWQEVARGQRSHGLIDVAGRKTLE